MNSALSMIGNKKDKVLKCEKYGEKNLKRVFIAVKKF